MRYLNIGGKLLSLENPVIMGILNVSSESFYAGSMYNTIDEAKAYVEKMIFEGADIIDVGGFSSSPGTPLIAEKEEIERLEPVVKCLFKEFPDQAFSIDTFRSGVVERLSEYGPFIVNDISGFEQDAGIVKTVARLGFPYILMHMRGTPENMIELANYKDVCLEVLTYLNNRLHILRQEGVEQAIIDPGFGFAKKIRHNFEMLKNLNVFLIPECPLLVGISRKSMIYKSLGTDVENALNGTTALHMIALMNGADILRVHDVKPAMEAVKLWKSVYRDVNE